MVFIPWTKKDPGHRQCVHSRYTEEFSYRDPSPPQQWPQLHAPKTQENMNPYALQWNSVLDYQIK